MARACRCLLLALVLAACPADDPSPDGIPQSDLRQEGGVREDGASPDKGSGKEAGTSHDHGAPVGDGWVPPDLGFSCKDCLLEQVCVHSVNSTTCKVVKSQCKYRTPACFSPKVNPCCVCEAQVCGLWATCTPPAGCPPPAAGSYDPERECFCYSK